MPFSIAQANSLLNSNVKGKYMGLFSSAPTDSQTDGVTFTELSGAGYARTLLSQPIKNAENRSITNDEIIFFPEAESNWGTATHFGIFNSKESGQPIIYGALESAVTIQTNYVPLFRVGQFRLTLT